MLLPLFFVGFTIHFATINTRLKEFIDKINLKFTIHFATINTDILLSTSTVIGIFTIHFATINTNNFLEFDCFYTNLQYTLLLLIQLFILLNIYNIMFLFFCRTLIFYKK